MRPGQRASAETRAKMSAAQRAPGVIERRREAHQKFWTPERREQARQRALTESADPAWRAKVRVRTAEAMADPDRKARQVEGIRRASSAPEYRERMSAITRRAMADPIKGPRILDGLAKARANPGRAARAAEGIRRTFEADHVAIEHRALVDAWKSARPAARNRFLSELFGPLWSTVK
jgi:hypothetical protein